MESTITYRERTGTRSVLFVLENDQVHAKGRNNLGAEFEASIPLADLRPTPSISRQYDLYFFYCLALGVVFFMVPLFPGAEFPEIMRGLGVVSILVGVAVFGRRITYHHYTNTSGVILLSIARTASRGSQFDAFIDALQQRIESTLRQ